MTATRGTSFGRVALVARAAVRDLFAGQGVAIAILALLGFVVADGDFEATSAAERHALVLRHRIELVAILATAAALLAAAHAVHEARRTLDLARLTTTPLSMFEAVAGKTLGVFAGVAAIALPAQLALLLIPESGLLRQCEQFAPREWVAPAQVELTRPDGERLRRRPGGREPALIEAGGRLDVRFDVDDPRRFELAVAVGRASEEPGAQPLFWSLEVAGKQLMRVDRGMNTTITTPLRDLERGPVVVTLRGLAGDEVLRVDPDDCRLRGPPGSIAGSVLRAAAGLLTLVFLASALAAGLAAALPDALAMVATGLVLLLAALRPLLLGVEEAVAHPGAHVEPALRFVANGLAHLLGVLPDLTRAAGANPIARGAAPWHGEDVWALLLSLLLGVAAAMLGGAWLRRTRGGVA